MFGKCYFIFQLVILVISAISIIYVPNTTTNSPQIGPGRHKRALIRLGLHRNRDTHHDFIDRRHLLPDVPPRPRRIFPTMLQYSGCRDHHIPAVDFDGATFFGLRQRDRADGRFDRVFDHNWEGGFAGSEDFVPSKEVKFPEQIINTTII